MTLTLLIATWILHMSLCTDTPVYQVYVKRFNSSEDLKQTVISEDSDPMNDIEDSLPFTSHDTLSSDDTQTYQVWFSGLEDR